jgi:hypothetical protein
MFTLNFYEFFAFFCGKNVVKKTGLSGIAVQRLHRKKHLLCALRASARALFCLQPSRAMPPAANPAASNGPISCAPARLAAETRPPTPEIIGTHCSFMGCAVFPAIYPGCGSSLIKVDKGCWTSGAQSKPVKASPSWSNSVKVCIDPDFLPSDFRTSFASRKPSRLFF